MHGELRVRAHLSPSSLKKGETRKNRWLRKILFLGLEPKVEIREYEDVDLAEVEIFWISIGRAWGCQLTNLTKGGEGTSGYHHTDESKRKMSTSHKGHSPTSGFSGKKHSDASKAKTSATLKANPDKTRRVISEEHKERLRVLRTGLKASPETRAKMSATHKAIGNHPLQSPEVREKISRSLRGRPLSFEHRQKLSEVLTGRKHTAETRAKISSSNKGKKKSKEHCKNISVANKAYWKCRKFGM